MLFNKENGRDRIESELQSNSGILEIDGSRYKGVKQDKFEYPSTGALGHGGCGTVDRVKFKSHIMAVKEMQITNEALRNRQLIRDIETLRKTNNDAGELFVKYYGYILTAERVYLCMELMDTCLERLLFKRNNRPFPEEIIGKIALNVTKALLALQDAYNLMHRDVCPANILMNSKGQIKVCDFGIVGTLIKSTAATNTRGRDLYLAPERFQDTSYKSRADVWSLGITLIHLAEGKNPYMRNIDSACSGIFLQIAIMNDPPPRLLDNNAFSEQFSTFIEKCLQKDPDARPRFNEMLNMPFLQEAKTKVVDVASWIRNQLNS